MQHGALLGAEAAAGPMQYATEQIANLSHAEQDGRQWLADQDHMQLTDHQAT